MTLSRVLATLTGRDAAPTPRRTASRGSAPDVAATLSKSERLMLVPGGAGEHSLGPTREVRERIAEILPGVTFDDDGRGAFARTGYSIAFDTGSEDHVRGVVLQIAGGPAAVPPIARLVAKTGWRLVAQDR